MSEFGPDVQPSPSGSPKTTNAAPVSGSAAQPLKAVGYDQGAAALSPTGGHNAAGPMSVGPGGASPAGGVGLYTPGPDASGASCPLPPPTAAPSCDVKPNKGAPAAPSTVAAKPATAITNRRFSGDSTLEAVALGKKTLASGAKGASVRRIQAALESLGYPTGATKVDGDFGGNTVDGVTAFQTAEHLESYSKPGVVGDSTMVRLDAITPQAGADAYEWREAEFNTSTTPKRAGLTNPRFKGDVVLETIATGIGALTKGQTGRHVHRVQLALAELGFVKVKATGVYDADTITGVGAFQAGFNVPLEGTQAGATETFSNGGEKQSGMLNPTTMAALDAYASKTIPKDAEVEIPGLPKGGPDYAKLFADGKLDITLALGYDEGGAHTNKRPVAIQYLTTELGFAMTDPRTATPDEMSKVGLDPKTADKEIIYFTRKMVSKTAGKEVAVTVKLLSAKDDGSDGAAIRDRFKGALENDDVVMYTGHARAGTGPDFDPHDKTDGNYVMGKGKNAQYNKEIDGVENQLDKTNFTDKKQVYLFWGCTTEHYDKHLDKKLGKSGEAGAKRDTKDIAVSNQPVYSARGLIGTLAFLRGMLAETDGATLKSLLDASMRTDIAKTEGFKS
ncbi:MAG: peptidoglycan-binding protein [Myxococcales bacterium]|nr:peptidoglycan-binding protein [Myxococcales bacterium]